MIKFQYKDTQYLPAFIRPENFEQFEIERGGPGLGSLIQFGNAALIRYIKSGHVNYHCSFLGTIDIPKRFIKMVDENNLERWLVQADEMQETYVNYYDYLIDRNRWFDTVIEFYREVNAGHVSY